MTPKVHVLLISAQAAPNLLPTLDPAIKPEHVVLLTSSKMKRQVRTDALTSKGLGHVDADDVVLDDTARTDTRLAAELLREIARNLRKFAQIDIGLHAPNHTSSTPTNTPYDHGSN